MSDQSHNEEFDQYLDIQDDDTQPSKPNNQIESNVEAALAAYAQLVQVDSNNQSNIDTEILNEENKSTKIDEEKSTKQKQNKATKSLDSAQSKKKKTTKSKKNGDKTKVKEQSLEKGLNTLIMDTPKKASDETLKNKTSYNSEIPEGMNIIKFSQSDENLNDSAGRKRKATDSNVEIEFKINKERLIPKKLRTATAEDIEKRKKKETSNNYKPLHNKSKIFSEEEDVLIDKLINTHCIQHKVSREEFIDLIWMNDNTHKVTKTEFWKLLADEFPDRSRSSLYKHVKRKYNNFKPRGKWSKAEDLKLKELCDEHDNKWNVIGQVLERMPEDCRDRYRNYVKHNKRLDEDNDEEKEQPKKTVSRWSEEELDYLNNIISLIMNISVQFYLNYCYTKDQKEDSSEKFDKWAEHLSKQQESLLEKANVKEKYNEVCLLVLNSINLNKKQNKVTSKFSKQWIDLKGDINKIIKEKNEEPVQPSKFQLFFTENGNLLSPNYFLMDIQKLINWTFISDLFSNGRTRIQVRYKCKSLIKQRINNLEKDAKSKYAELLPSILKAMKEVSTSLNDGNVFEDEIDWFYSHAKWIEIIDKDASVEFYEHFKVDPWLMKEIYSYAKFAYGVSESMNNLSKILEFLSDKVEA